MSHFLIRFNKTRGLPDRGSMEHVWRVFKDGEEYLFKHLKITVPIWDEQTGLDFNVACDGVLIIDHETSTAIIQAFPDNETRSN